MDREEYHQERNFSTNTDNLQGITDGKGAGLWKAAWAGQASAGSRNAQLMARNQSQCYAQNHLQALTSCCVPRSQWGALTVILLALLIPERLPGRCSWSKCQGNGTEDDHTCYRQTVTAALMRSQLISYGLKSRQPRPTAPEPNPKPHRKNVETSPGCARVPQG